MKKIKLLKCLINRNYIIVNNETKVIFNICSNIKGLKKNDSVYIEFGIISKNFKAKYIDAFFNS